MPPLIEGAPAVSVKERPYLFLLHQPLVETVVGQQIVKSAELKVGSLDVVVLLRIVVD